MLTIGCLATLIALPLSQATQSESNYIPYPRSDGKYELQSQGLRAHFIPYAASITNLFIADQHGIERDIVLGFDNASTYSTSRFHPHLNGVPGRYANRIRNSTFSFNEVDYHTDPNDNGGLDTLHGGSKGWDYREWNITAYTNSSITFSLFDPDGEEKEGGGFPGDVVAYVTYTLRNWSWYVTMTALALTRDTPVMLTNHGYWNLDGYQNPETDLVLEHTLHLPFAGQRIATDGISVPTGEVLANEEFGLNDFWSKPKRLGANLTSLELMGNCGTGCTGYDNCFINSRREGGEVWEKDPVAVLASEWSGISVSVFSDQDAVQVYTCNNMNGSFPLKSTQGFIDDESRPRVSNKYSCVVLEVQDWIDGINHPEWGREQKQIFGPQSGPYVLRARHDFAVQRTDDGKVDDGSETECTGDE